jgi:hypothetical protein
MSGMTPETTRRTLNAASMAIALRAGEDGTIADALGSFLSELGVDIDDWVVFVRAKAMAMGRDFAESTDGERPEIALGAAVAVALGEGFMLGVEFARAQASHLAAMQ